MEATAALVPIVILAAAAFLLRGKSPVAARLCANALVGAMAVPMAMVTCWVLSAGEVRLFWMIRLDVGLREVAFVMALGGVAGLLAGCSGMGVRVVTFGNLVRVLWGGFAGACAPALVLWLVVAGLFLWLFIGLSPMGLVVGMKLTTTAPPEPDEPSWWPKPPAGWSPGDGTGAPGGRVRGETEPGEE